MEAFKETVKITKEQLNIFVVCAKHYISANISKKSQLWINLDNLLPLATKKLKKVEREKDLVRMKYCKKTATKHLDFNKTGNYQFTEEDNLKVLEEFDRIDAEETELPAGFIVPKGEYPEKGLTYDIRNSFKGIVIDRNEYAGIENDALKKMLEEENARIEQEEEEEIEA